MAEAITRPDFLAIAERIAAANREQEAAILDYARLGRAGIARAILIGQLLIEVQEKVRGEFDEWIAAYHASLDHFPSRARCYCYKALATKFSTVEDVPADIATINRALALAGYLGIPESEDSATRPKLFEPVKMLTRFASQLDTIAAWPAEQRHEVLRVAREVVARLEAIEPAA